MKYGYKDKDKCYEDFKEYMQDTFTYGNDFYKLLDSVYYNIKDTTNWVKRLKEILLEIDDINGEDFKILNAYDWRVF